jgi:serine/threonine protein kinase/Tfp pilus assembly protein PilF
MPLMTGTRLGPYEIVAPLGAGGMGEVYRARDPRLGRDVALKVLPEALALSPDRLARFEREARTVAGLNHPNIVVLHSIEKDGETRFLTMELVEGQNLASLVSSGGLPVPRVLDLAIPIADALVAAHERGVVHRDLKPANVMVSREGRLKVLDFGLAKLAFASDEDATTATMAAPISDIGQVVGTVPYMAPEQLKGAPVDARSDLFSFGIMVYELASGKRPFAGQSQVEISSSILRDTPPSLAILRTDLPPPLVHIVERCLEKNPRERFQTALDVLNELRSIRRTLERGAHAATAARRPDPDQVASIAVLPFVNRSASVDDEYFSDGLADELLNVLAKIKGLRVSARTSSFQFKGRNEDLAVIGQKLGVATILEGSVRKAGNRVRIAVQLVKVSDGYQLWSETYDRMLDDIFAVQDDIAQSVVKELRRTLLGEEADSQASGEARAAVAKAAKGRATDPEAHRLYFLGRHFIDRFTREDIAKAIEYLKQALEVDPEFALAWAELSRSYANQAGIGWIPTAEGFRLAREAAERALAIEPDLAEAHGAIGSIRMFWDWDWRGAEASLARALELAPSSVLVRRRLAALAMNLGRLEHSIEAYQRILELDPLSSPAYMNLGVMYYARGGFREAETNLRKMLELVPHRAGAHSYLALALLAQGRGEEALAEVVQESDVVYKLWGMALVHDALGHRGESDAALRELIEKFASGGSYQVAEVYAGRGEIDHAFEWLERAHADHDVGLVGTKLSAPLRSLHGDPRWPAFLKKMGFEE